MATVKKQRRIYHLERQGFNLEVSLDEVAGVGTYAEIEIQAEQDRLDAAKAVLLPPPPPPSPILTRELLYTAVTRATSRVTLLASEASLRAAVAEGIAKFGRLDIVSANAGISPYTQNPETWNVSDERWNDVVDVNLVGVRNTIVAGQVLRALLPSGSPVLTVTAAGRRATTGLPPSPLSSCPCCCRSWRKVD